MARCLSRLSLASFSSPRLVPKIAPYYAVTSDRRCHSGSASYERVIFSGIQPTGVPHIGNYFGAIQAWVRMQERFGNVILSVVDLHSLTAGIQPDQLRKNNLELFASLIACGIDPEKTILFQQSAISQHAELAWILGCLTTMPKLQHLPQWKQKSEGKAETPLGLFTYPVLQAADILLYKATDVPVGDDQVKHIELARHLAKLFNNKYGQTFPQPKPIVGDFNRIKSLRSPTIKMSKSETDSKSRIIITDSPKVIVQKIKKAITDCDSFISYNPTLRPGVSNIVDIHAAFKEELPEEICEQCIGMDTVAYKNLVADVISEGLVSVREEFMRLMSDKEHLESLIQRGNEKARNIAENNFQEVKSKVGLTR